MTEKLEKIVRYEYFEDGFPGLLEGISIDEAIYFLQRAKEFGATVATIDADEDDEGRTRYAGLSAYYPRLESDEELEQRQKDWDEWEASPKPIIIPYGYEPRILELPDGGYEIKMGGARVIWPDSPTNEK